MVRTYLHEIGRVPLLTHEQEIVYGKQVQQMMSLYQEIKGVKTPFDDRIVLTEIFNQMK